MRKEYPGGGQTGRLGVDGHVTCVVGRYASRREHDEPRQHAVLTT